MAKKDDQTTANTEAALALNTAVAEVFPPSIEQQLRDEIKEIAAKLEKVIDNNSRLRLVNELEALANLGLEPVNQESDLVSKNTVDSTEVK